MADTPGSAALIEQLVKGASGFNPVTMGVTALTSLAGMIQGAVNIGKGKSAAARNVRPVLDESKPYEDMLSLYEQQAQYGYDPNTLKFVTEENQNALTATLQSMLMAGASPNDVAGAYAGYSNQLQKIASEDSEKRWQKVNAVAIATDKLSAVKEKEFLYNEDAPYKDAAQAAAAQQNAGMQQLWGGLTSFTGNVVKQDAANKSYTSDILAQLAKIFPSAAKTNEAAGTEYTGNTKEAWLTPEAQQRDFQNFLAAWDAKLKTGVGTGGASDGGQTTSGGGTQTGSEMLNQILKLLFKG